MPNAIKYKTGNITGSLQKSTIALGVTTGSIAGPTATTGWYSGITPSAGKYNIYETSISQNPNIYCPVNDAELIQFVRSKGATGNNTASLSASLAWIGTQTNLMAVNFDYENIVTNELVLNLDAGFVGSYPTTASNWYDISGNAFNGTLTNGPTFNSANSGSIVFDGVDDYVEVSNNTILNPSLNMTLSSWIKITTFVSRMSIFGKGSLSPGFGGFDFRIDCCEINNPMQLNLVKYGIVDQRVPISTLSTNTWYNISAVQSSTKVDYYINGLSVGSFSNSTAYQTNTGSLRIGRDRNVIYTPASISNILYYNRELSAAEILQNYNAQKSRYGL